MTARTIVGFCAITTLLGIAIYLLVQIPWEFGIGGIVALLTILLAVANDAPDPSSPDGARFGRVRRPPNEPPCS
jgi:hypothetical protein